LRLEAIIDSISEHVTVNSQIDRNTSSNSSNEEEKVAEDDDGEFSGTKAL
jgi:hypothetical protein